MKTLPLLLLSSVLLAASGSALAHTFGNSTSISSDPELVAAVDPPSCDPPLPAASGGSSDAGPGGALMSDADPVSPYSGKFFLRFVDMRLEGVFPIVITRRYDSQSGLMTPLGWGWAFEHDLRLYDQPANQSVVVRTRCGIRTRYIETGGAFALADPMQGNRPELVATATGYNWLHRDGSRDEFNAEGLLLRRYNREGHYHEFKYRKDASQQNEKKPIQAFSRYALNPNASMVVARSYQVEEIREFLADGTDTNRYVTFDYDDALGRLTSITSYDGRTVTYHHDEIPADRGNLVEVHELGGVISTYSYEDPLDPHNLTRFDKGQGTKPVFNSYDALDRVEFQTIGDPDSTLDPSDPAAAEARFHFMYEDMMSPASTVTQVIREVDPGTWTESRTATYTYTADGRPVSAEGAVRFELEWETTRGYPTDLRFLDDADPPNVIKHQKFTYDADGRLTNRWFVGPDGTTKLHEETWTWDHGWLASHERQGFNPDGTENPDDRFLTEFMFCRDGDIGCATPSAGAAPPVAIKEIKEWKSGSSYRVTTLQQNPQNLLAYIQPPDAGDTLRVTRSYYTAVDPDADAIGLLKEIELEINGMPDPHLHQTLTYDDAGRVATATDARGKPTTFTWDDRGRIETIQNALTEVTRFTYAAPNQDSAPAPLVPGDYLHLRTIGEGSAAEQTHRFTWDSRGRSTFVERKTDAGTFEAFLDVTYSQPAAGLLRQETTFEQAGVSRTTAVQEDPWGRVQAITDNALNTTTLAYDGAGRREAVARPQGGTEFVYDSLDRVTTVREIPEAGTGPLETDLAYDAAGNVTQVTDPRDAITDYAYDTLSQLESVTAPGALIQPVQYVYDARGRLEALTNGRGDVLTYVYHPWGGLEKVEHDDAETPALIDRTVSYTYDFAGNLTTVSDDTILPGGPLYTITYDDLNREHVTTVHYLPTGGDRTLTSAYDEAGQRTQLSYGDAADSPVQNWGHNALGQLESLHFNAAGTGPSLQFLYHQNDAVRQITYSGSVVADLQYEPGTGVLDQLDVTHQSAPRYALDYQPPDTLLRVVGRTETLGTDPAELTTYGYDPFGRLDTAAYAAPSGLTDDGFVYDDSGNRKDAGGPSSWIFDEANVLTASPDRGYTVDADGNLEILTEPSTSSTLATLTWTTDNRLASYTRPSGETASYAYDPFGRRIRKTVDPDGPGVGIAPTTTWYVWDGERLLAEHDEAGVRQRRYDYALGFAPVRMIEGVSPGELAYNVHADHLDTPKVLTDAAGDVVWKADHAAFGQAVVDSGVSTVEFNIRFPGQYFDEETGLHYNRFRYYDPSVGRYISADPIGQQGGINLYAYVGNSPTNFIDPLGLILTYSDPATRRAVNEARSYYADHGVSDPFTSLESSPFTYTVEGNSDGEGSYDSSSRTIGWDPNSGQSLVCGESEAGTQSPALVLLHEGEHARGHDDNPTGYNRRRNESDSDYTNAEERRVITGPEADAARRTGEPSRGGHYGSPTPVGCVTCRR